MTDTIFIDNREKNQAVYSMFDRHLKKYPNFSVEVKYLELGDIVCNSTSIERKSAPDFFSSIRKERFWLNLKNSQEVHNHTLIWLDATEDDFMRVFARGFKYGYESYMGALAKLLNMGIPIIRYTNREDAALLFLNMFKSDNSKKKADLSLGRKKLGIPIDHRRFRSIAEITGIGMSTAETLLLQHRSVEKLIRYAKKQKDNKVMKKITEFFVGEVEK